MNKLQKALLYSQRNGGTWVDLVLSFHLLNIHSAQPVSKGIWEALF